LQRVLPSSRVHDEQHLAMGSERLLYSPIMVLGQRHLVQHSSDHLSEQLLQEQEMVLQNNGHPDFDLLDHPDHLNLLKRFLSIVPGLQRQILDSVLYQTIQPLPFLQRWYSLRVHLLWFQIPKP